MHWRQPEGEVLRIGLELKSSKFPRMKDLEDFVSVLVTRNGEQVMSGCFKLPVTVGRMAQNSVPIGNIPADKSISRVHAQIERSGDGLQLIDRSVNGTRYRGRLLKPGDAVKLQDRDAFEIRGYHIEVARATHDASIPVVFEAQIFVDEIRKEKPRLIGEMIMLFIKTAKGLRLDQAPVAAVPQMRSILARHRLDGEQPFAAIAGVEGQGWLHANPAKERPAMMINRAPVTEVKLRLFPRDVIEVGRVRIELYPPGEKSLKCPNPSCQLLNEYNSHESCRFCGFRLVHGITRIASATQPSR